MKNSKLLILLLAMVMILAISAVSAADTNDTSDSVAQAVDEAPVEEVSSEDVDAVAATDNTDVLADVGDKNFTQLQAEIDQSTTGMINLQSNYIRAEGESDIVINKNFNIFGNDAYTIDAKNLGGIFKINSGCSVLLNNVILTNGNGINGGAIYNEGTVNIMSSTLTDNKATLGGAVYNTGITAISGSTLTGNTADKGGAVYSTGTLVVDGTDFNENVATYRGGAVYNEGNFEATGSTFDRNDITFRSLNQDNGGAAIYNNGGTTNLDNVKVINNIKDIVYREGNAGDFINAAITSTGRLYIDNSYIANNSGSYGGGVYVTGDETFTVSNTLFENNVATFGAAIYDEGTDIIVENCNFTANHCEGAGSPGTANTQAAAILVMKPTSSAIITGSRFNRNSAKLGGAISLSDVGGNSIIDNCIFTDNVAQTGGAVYSFGDSSLDITDSEFENNSATKMAGAIYIINDKESTIDNCTFTDNSATSEGGAIYAWVTPTLTLSDSTFTDNDASFGSAISNDGGMALSQNTITGASTVPIGNYYGTIESEMFVNILQGQTVVTILPTNEITAYVTDDNGNAIIDNNLVLLIEGNEVATAYNKATGAHTATYTFTNPGSYEVTAKDYDAAHTTPATIVFESPLSSLQALIDANTNGTLDLTYGFTYLENHDSAIKDTGVVISKNIIINGNGVTIDGATVSRLFTVNDGFSLTLNDVIITNGAASEGAGVYVDAGAGLVANDAVFTNNIAQEYDGGAIYTNGGTITLTDCVLDSNDVTKLETSSSANHGGAAIYAKNAVVTLTNTNVTNNGRDLNRTNGDLANGVLNLLNSETTITGCLFENNTGIYGGAIYAEDGEIDISESSFVANNAYSGGAIQLEGVDFNIEDTTFTDNNKAVGTGSPGYTAGGGAIFAKYSDGTMDNITVKGSYSSQGGSIDLEHSQTTITGSTFEDNHAENRGGAIWAWGPGIIVDNCTFVNNSADTRGGAIFLYDNDGGSAATINNVVFDSNTAGDAGAIWAWDNVDISDCDFTDNTATGTGGAIVFTEYCTGSSLTGSNFTGNAADTGNAVYNNHGTITLSNNQISSTNADIYNNGTIDSYINATFLGNQTISAEMGDVFVLNATLTDDNGNVIDDCNFRFSVNGVTIDEISFNPDTGLYTTEYYIATAGPKVVSTNYELIGMEIFTGILDVPKANVTEFTVEVRFDSIPVGENVTIYVTLLGVNGEGLNETFNVIVNNTEYPVTVANGTGSFNVSGLASGHYSALGIFPGNDNYNGAYATEIFTVLYSDPILNVTSEDITYGEDAVINITLTEADGTPLDGRVGITVGGIFSLDVTIAGFASITVPNLPANETGWAIGVFYHGDEDHLNVWNDTETVKVAKATPTVDLTGPFEISIGENADFKATIDAKADVYALNIWVDGVEYIVMGPGEWDSNVAEFMITSDWLPEARDYNITVQFIGNENYTASENASQILTVNKIDVGNVIQISGSTVTYGENATVTVELPMDAEGNVTVTIPGVGTFNETVEGGIAVVEIPGLGVDLYELFAVDYSGDNKYASHTGMVTVEVKQAKSSVEIETISDSVYPGQATIKYTVVNATTIKINVAYENLTPVYNATIESVDTVYTGSFDLSGLAAAKYIVVIYNEGNENYTFSASDAGFTVFENSTFDLNVSFPENSTDTVFSISVPKDAGGYLLVDIDGQHYYAPVENGTATVVVPGLAPGNYTAVISYTGDGKYDNATITKEVTVPSNLPEDALTIPENGDTETPTTYSISLPADATGFLIVDVDGTKYVAALENGSASVTVPALSEGQHNVTVTYTGDDKYSSASKSTTLNVKKPVYKITNNKNVKAVYSAKAYYKVLVTKDGKAVGAGEKVTIKYNGKTYTVKTDSKGYATLKLNTKVKVKKYTITAEYKGVKVTNKVTIKHVIKAKNKKVKKSKKVTKVKITLKKVNGKVLKAKKLKVKFRGKKYTVKTNKKGVAKWKVKKSMLKKLKVGKKYKYKVTYGKDVVTKKLTIKK